MEKAGNMTGKMKKFCSWKQDHTYWKQMTFTLSFGEVVRIIKKDR